MTEIMETMWNSQGSKNELGTNERYWATKDRKRRKVVMRVNQ